MWWCFAPRQGTSWWEQVRCALFVFFSLIHYLVLAGAGSGSFTNQGWLAFGGEPGFDGDVNAIVSTVDPVYHLFEVTYIGGNFVKAGGNVAPRVVQWQDGIFTPIAPAANGPIYALAALSDGTLFAGGGFTTLDGTQTTRYVAKWDGTTWTSLGVGTNGPVYALAVAPDGSLYAGGNFTSAGGNTVNYVAQWKDSQWRSLKGGTNAPVTALVWSNGQLYVGGKFLSAGGQGAKHVARWDPTLERWFPLSLGTNGFVTCLCTDDEGNIYAGGEFTMAGGMPANRVAKWDGVEWLNLGDGVNGVSRCAVPDPSGGILLGGEFTSAGGVSVTGLARWRADAWESCGAVLSSPAGLPVYVGALAWGFSSHHLFVGGKFQNVNGQRTNNIARWNGKTWLQCRPGFNGAVQAVCVDPSGDVYVGGRFSVAADTQTTALRIVKWDGQGWKPFGPGLPGLFTVHDIKRGPDGRIYAAGFGPSTTDVRRWNNQMWEWLGVANMVLSLYFSDNGSLYAGGAAVGFGGGQSGNLGKWSEALWRWLPMTDPLPMNNAVYTLARLPSDEEFLCVGGSLNVPYPNVLAYRLTSSTEELLPLGSGLNAPVKAFAVAGGRLYAGGDFTSTVGTSSSLAGVAVFDGVDWRDVAGGVSGSVLALAGDPGGKLFVGGWISAVGGGTLSTPAIACFDGTRWQALGDGCVGGGVAELCLDGAGNLWVGGTFVDAGDKCSPYFACYRTSWFAPAQNDTLTTSGNLWALALGFNEMGLAYTQWSQTESALVSHILANDSRYRVTGRISSPALLLPYAAVGSDRYVRAKFYVYASGNDDWRTTGAMPNVRLRLSHRFSQTAILEIFNHLNVDPEASDRFGRELRPSSIPDMPSCYRVDMDPVDIPFLQNNAQSEGITCGYEAYSFDPQDQGTVALAEVVVGTYPRLNDIGAPAKVYAPTATDAGSLAVRDPADLSLANMVLGSSPGEFPKTETDPNVPAPRYWESSAGVTLDTSLVPADHFGVVQREFWPGSYSERIRVNPGRLYKIRYHVTSSQPTTSQSQMRLRARTVRYLWCQKFEIGGAWAAGPLNNLAATQALPGVGCLNPDKVGTENGGWYTLLFRSPLDGGIRPEFPADIPLAQRMPNLWAEPPTGTDTYSFRDLRVCFDNLDSLSGSDLRVLEQGQFTLDRIEIRGYVDFLEW
ncbi:MAG: hypothetical protein N2Z21_02025 [Candidatus Sumerlaeaceae bacterium]|nr:hypothetical protein [Candidatus Sumerlaeaceae bacterium]